MATIRITTVITGTIMIMILRAFIVPGPRTEGVVMDYNGLWGPFRGVRAIVPRNIGIQVWLGSRFGWDPGLVQIMQFYKLPRFLGAAI